MNDYSKYKAKKTFYNGVEFKSNLEARVAERFDELGILWQYEPHCFRGKNFVGGQYTPDFYLPDDDLYIEVAGVWDERHYINFINLFSQTSIGKWVSIEGSEDYQFSKIGLLGIDSDGDFVYPVEDNGQILLNDTRILAQCLNCDKYFAHLLKYNNIFGCPHCKSGLHRNCIRPIFNIFD